MFRARTAVLLIAVVLLSACHSARLPILASGEITTVEADVIEATFRHVIDRHYFSRYKWEQGYCLAIYDKATSPAFNLRLAEYQAPPIRPRNKYRHGVDRIFTIRSLTKVDATFYRVELDSYAGPMSGYTRIYEVRLKEGRWQAAQDPTAPELISLLPKQGATIAQH